MILRPHNPDEQVLKKIAELLWEIDKKEAPRPSPPPKQTKSPNISGDRLHNKAKELQDKLNNVRRNRDEQKRKELKPFKMENKQSMQIMEKKPVKPLPERAKDIMQERQRRQLEHNRKKQQEEDKRKRQEQAQLAPFRKDNERKLNPEEYLKKQQDYNRKRMEHLNDLNLKELEQKTLKNTYRPRINTQSAELLRARPELTQLTFLQRQQYYNMQREKQFAKLRYEVDRRVMPFEPNITERELSKSYRKLPKDASSQKISLKETQKRPQQQNKPSMAAFDVTFSTPRGDNSMRNRNISPRPSPQRKSRGNTPITPAKKSLKELGPSKSLSKLTKTNTHPHTSVSPQPFFGRQENDHPHQRTTPLEFLSEHNPQSNNRVRTEADSPQSPVNPERELKLRELIYRHRYEVLTFFKDLTRKDSNRHCQPHPINSHR